MPRSRHDLLRLLTHRTLVEALWSILEKCDPERPRGACEPGCWAQDEGAVIQGFGGAGQSVNACSFDDALYDATVI